MRYALYSIVLLVQGKLSLKDIATASPTSLIRTIPAPPSVAVEDPSNLRVHLAPVASTVENSDKSPGTSSATFHPSSPRNHASRLAIACPFTAVGAIGMISNLDNCRSHYASLPKRTGHRKNEHIG